MAHLLGAEDISITFGTRTVLDSVTLGIDTGDRIGIVGRNGDGKSTLMRILAKHQEPDSGRVTWRGGVSVGFLDQQDILDHNHSVRTAVLGEAADHQWVTDPAKRDVADGLLAGLDWEAPVGSLSGGQRRRVALAALLMGEHDVIMLDEPTNHLDVEGVAWLAEHIKARTPSATKAAAGAPQRGSGADRTAFLVVTHDRWFHDEVCTLTWEVHDAAVDSFEGGYAAYTLARAERDRQAAVEEQKRQQLVKKELAWLRRGAPARTTKAKFRVDAANALISDVPVHRDEVQLKKMATARLGKDVLDMENLSYRAGEQKLFSDVTFRLAPGERVGVVGVNGAGKSTLLRLLDGQLEPEAGRVKRGKTVKTAILTQEVTELREREHMRVLEVMTEEKSVFEVGGKELSGSQLLETLGFSRSRQWTPVRDLSGGERRRLQLLKLLTGEPNVLMLDEPTNDLDTDTLAAMEDLLDGWPGTLIVVSHDRYLLERVTDHQVALLGDGQIRALPGGVEQYLGLRAGMEQSSTTPPSTGSGPAEQVPSAVSEAQKRQARKDMQRLEKQMERLSEQQDQLHAQMAAAGEAVDLEKLTALQKQLREVDTELEETEEAWLRASETAEQ
ncbi:ABC-F family ATP-binding cassette domain-containing protein [Nesterenkonia alkaliphila]|uniref:ATP-binding cassette domain-containing protein n=1 Tax=Nesterenkonia alkaliphila TaxID=1463631 RepID=A0A7K1UM38_9MICC|nr:ABC-F family ATP-binding cassette domain-containing protein [Nesterenkonia alkaliphila]MVT27504.1 ATP-binding cassette domain-containing protein [Nesterenkonia alkaliphila]GFZ94797.1 ABC transporter ATP-binding protein [Nesterenkonia alkaliphila]